MLAVRTRLRAVKLAMRTRLGAAILGARIASGGAAVKLAVAPPEYAAAALGHVAGKLSVVLYGMLKNMTPYDERKHREQLGLLTGAEQTSSTPVEVTLELVDLVDPQTALNEEPSSTDDLRPIL